ncbi:dihydrofolate reductase family protein [Actinocorallia longicatena]|uniref:Dihydrofolate reductase family protein n=1 Tax=Actinocorallia longicatena TaxID=111803 RepID=A0ABP6QDY1_9ACTN
MRKIISSFFVSLDGVVEAPHEWHFPWFNDEMGAAVGAAMEQCDTALFGRKTFEEFASYWPAQGPEVEFSSFINGIEKHVVSSTLTTTDWQNSHIIGGGAAAKEIQALKERDGKDISITGSATLVCWLLEQGLVDELRLLIHPVAVGSGAKLFDSATRQIPLKVVSSTTFSTGVLSVTYVPADPEPEAN